MTDKPAPTAREIATAINLHSRECFLCIKPDYDVIDRGERMIRAAVQAETERCYKVATSWPLSSENMFQAEKWAKHGWSNAVAAACSVGVAAAIREGGKKDE